MYCLDTTEAFMLTPWIRCCKIYLKTASEIL